MISLWKVREMVDKATNLVMNYTETESKVRDATNDDPWGPSGQQMQEVASFTFTYEQFPEVMGMLWKRMLHEGSANWRRTYKSLLLLDYLLKNGSERVVTSAREHVYDLRTLENFTFVDENGKDQGINIRHKVTDMIEFIQDDDRLRDDRKKAKKNKDKYVGMSSDSMGFRGSGSSGFDSGWKENWPSSSGGGGGRVSRSGFRDNSPELDDDPYRQQPSPALSGGGGGADDFRDDSASEHNTSFDSNKFSSGPTSLPAAANNAKKVVKKVRKPIDLGAAANFAQTAQPASTTNASKPKTDNSLIEDIFNNGGGSNNANVVDDFDPRGVESGGYSTLSSDANANNGDFGNFSAAFGNNGSGNNGSNGDGFADFSSAFTSTGAAATSDNDLFSSLPTASDLPQLANPARAPAPPSPQGNGGFDLLGGGSGGTSAAPASSLDLLGGLDMGSSVSAGIPNLLPGSSVPPMMGGGVSATPNVMSSMMGAPMSLPAQPTPSGGLLAPAAAANPVPMNINLAQNATSAKADTKIPERWGNVGGLNIDLDNLSLGGKNQTKKSVPMNAMKTNSSSSESPVSPLGASAGFGSVQPNPLQPNFSAPSSSGLDGLL